MRSIIIIEIEHCTGTDLHPNQPEAGIAEALFNFGIGPDEGPGPNEDIQGWISMMGEDYRVTSFDVIKDNVPLEPVQNRGY